MTQAVLAKLAVRMRRFAYDPSQRFRAWLRTVAKNACRDCMAERRRTIGAIARGVTGQDDLIETAEGARRPGPSTRGRVRPGIAG